MPWLPIFVSPLNSWSWSCHSTSIRVAEGAGWFRNQWIVYFQRDFHNYKWNITLCKLWGCPDLTLVWLVIKKSIRKLMLTLSSMYPPKHLQLTRPKIAHYSILDTRISSVRSPYSSVTLRVTPLDSETGWTGELWLNRVLLILKD